MTTEMFKYEAAIAILDSYAAKTNSNAFWRAYRKFKAVIASIAWVDFYCDGVSADQALAWAWEDAQMAVIGRSEPSLNAAVLNLWLYTRPEKKEEFAKVLKQAFDAAESGTADTVPRRYLPSWRNKPIRKPEDGFGEAAILPCWGPRLREHAVDSGSDADQTENQFVLMEINERETLARDKATRAALAAAKAATRKKKSGK